MRPKTTGAVPATTSALATWATPSILAVVLILFSPAVAVYVTVGTTPAGGSGNIVVEGFENGSFPLDPVGTYQGSTYYTYSTSTGAAGVSTTVAAAGTRSLMVDGGLAAASNSAFQLTQSLCTSGVSFKVRANSLGSGSASSYIGFSSSATNAQAGDSLISFNWGAGSALVVAYDTPTQALGTTPQTIQFISVADTWYTLGIVCIDADSIKLINYGAGTQQIVNLGTPWGAMTYMHFGASNNQGDLFVDDVNFGAVTLPSAGASLIFCSAKSQERFGYNYKEGVTSFPGTITNTVEGYHFSGDADNFDYLGKGFSAVTKAEVYFRIEANIENVDSVFRAAFSFVDHAPYELGTAPDIRWNGPDDAGANAKGDGYETEGLADHIEVRFVETGNDWAIQFRYATAGDIKDVGQTYEGYDPNTPTTFKFVVDTTPSTGYFSVEKGDGTDILGMNYSLATITGNPFSGDSMRAQWFIGYAADTFTNTNADTYLDDDVNSSTCIYALGGQTATAVGNPGALDVDPATESPGDDGEVAVATGIADAGGRLGISIGIGSTGGQLLVSIMLMLILGLFIYNEVHHSIAGFLVGIALGLVLSIFTGIMPAVVTFLLVLFGAVFVGMRWFSGSGAAKDAGGI